MRFLFGKHDGGNGAGGQGKRGVAHPFGDFAQVPGVGGFVSHDGFVIAEAAVQFYRPFLPALIDEHRHQLLLQSFLLQVQYPLLDVYEYYDVPFQQHSPILQSEDY